VNLIKRTDALNSSYCYHYALER